MKESEKDPLVPITLEQGRCQQEACRKELQKTKNASKKTLYSVLFFFFVCLFFSSHPGTFFFEKNVTNEEISTKECHRPSVPYEGTSSFSFKPEEYQILKVEYRERAHGRHLSIINSQAIVLVDESLSDVTVDVDVKFSHRVSQDAFSIEQKIEGDHYVIYLENNPVEDFRVCAKLDIVIKVPKASALKSLSIDLPNNDYELKENLSFEKLVLRSSNGHFRFQEGISVGYINLTGSNGSIKGTINSLTGNVFVRTSNGAIELVVKEIQPSEKHNITLKSSNGYIFALLPDAFDSRFDLKSYFGKLSVESIHPQKIHRQTTSSRQSSGYYGEKESIRGDVSLSTSNGRVRLSYE
ncbi:hypothetical protein BY458DRAFT_494214 [Sporodiniella umbellata]|nr:hypothetical protein BY458DRAFT_494214 [Sporodiniella umbellata]